MTCIVGFIDDSGDIYMGGDSAGVSGFDIRTCSNPKVFINGEFIMGYTSSFRMGQLLQYSFSPPKYISELHGDIHKYMCTEFVNSLRQCLSNGGYARNDSGEESGGFFLVGFKGRLFEIQSDFQVFECSEPYNSVGCGESFALGSLWQNNAVYGENKVKEALKCAEYFSAGVRSPFTILKLPKEA